MPNETQKKQIDPQQTLLVHKKNEQELLYDLSQLWMSGIGLDAIIEICNQSIEKHLAPGKGGLFLYDRETGKFAIAGRHPWSAELQEELSSLAASIWRGTEILHPGQEVVFQYENTEHSGYLTFMAGDLELVGAIIVAYPDGVDLSDKPDLQRLQELIAAHTGVALQQLRSFSQMTSRKVVEIPELYGVDQMLSSRPGALQVLPPIVDLLCDTFEYDTASLFLINEARTHLQLEIARPEMPNAVTINISEDPMIQELISDAKALLLNDIAEASPVAGPLRRFQPEIRSFMAVCMVYQGEVLGTINLTNSTPNVYTEEDLRHLAIIANQGAMIYATACNLLRLEAVLQDVLESVPVGIISLDHRRQSALANPAALRILEVSTDRTAGYQELSEQLRELGLTSWQQWKDSGTTQKQETTLETVIRSRVIKTRFTDLRDSAGIPTGDVVILEDITEEKTLQERLHRNERMVALGELSAGIAHEIKNPLTSIKGFTQLLPLKFDNQKFREKFTAVIDNEVNRLNTIVEGMLSFAHPKVRQFTSCKVNEVLEKMLMLLEHKCQKQNIL